MKALFPIPIFTIFLIFLFHDMYSASIVNRFDKNGAQNAMERQIYMNHLMEASRQGVSPHSYGIMIQKKDATQDGERLYLNVKPTGSIEEARSYFNDMEIKEFFTDAQDNTNQSIAKEQVGVGIYVLNMGEEDMVTGTVYIDSLIYVLRNPNPNFSEKICNGLYMRETSTYKYIPMLTNTGYRPIITNRTTSYRVQGRYYFDAELTHWPLDTQTYEVMIELENTPLREAQLCFMQDFSGISPLLRFAGRNLTDFKTSFDVVVRESPPHMLIERNGTVQSYTKFSKLIFRITASRPYLRSFIKTFLPPIFICFVVLYTYMIPYNDSLSRISVLGSTLIASVMFHVGINGSLPHSRYLSKADVFMVCLYIVEITAFFLAMLLLRLRKGGRINLAKKIASYSELPGMFGTPVIFIALFFDDPSMMLMIAPTFTICAILAIFFIVFCIRYILRTRVYALLGKAVTDYRVQIVEGVGEDDGWIEGKFGKN